MSSMFSDARSRILEMAEARLEKYVLEPLLSKIDAESNLVEKQLFKIEKKGDPLRKKAYNADLKAFTKMKKSVEKYRKESRAMLKEKLGETMPEVKISKVSRTVVKKSRAK